MPILNILCNTRSLPRKRFSKHIFNKKTCVEAKYLHVKISIEIPIVNLW